MFIIVATSALPYLRGVWIPPRDAEYLGKGMGMLTERERCERGIKL